MLCDLLLERWSCSRSNFFGHVVLIMIKAMKVLLLIWGVPHFSFIFWLSAGWHHSAHATRSDEQFFLLVDGRIRWYTLEVFLLAFFKHFSIHWSIGTNSQFLCISEIFLVSFLPFLLPLAETELFGRPLNKTRFLVHWFCTLHLLCVGCHIITMIPWTFIFH